MFVPQGVPHAFSNPTGKPVKVFFQSSVPGGHENYFDELMSLLQRTSGRTTSPVSEPGTTSSRSPHLARPGQTERLRDMSTSLVVGGSGGLGQYIAERLAGRGDDVIRSEERR